MRGKRKRAVGLAIGSHKIALAEIDIDAEGIVDIIQTVVAETPSEAIINGRIANPAIISRAIRELFGSSSIYNTKELALAIPNIGVVTRLQILPSMSRSETLEALMGEVENYATLAVGEPVLDFQIISKADEASGIPMEVLFAAASRELINSYLSVMESININLTAMEPQSLAVIHALTNLSGKNNTDGHVEPLVGEEPAIAVIVEGNTGEVIIVQDKDIRFIHDIEIGGREPQAERYIQDLTRELRSTERYYQEMASTAENIENISLLSDGWDMPGLCDGLSESLNLPVTELQPPRPATGKVADGETTSNLSVYAAIGAAVRMANRDESGIDLSSSKKSVAGSLRKWAVLLLLLISILGLMATSTRFVFRTKADSVEQELVSLRERQDISEAQAAAEISIIESSIAALKTQVDITDAAMNSIKWANCAKILEETKQIIPKSIWLTSLRWIGTDSVSFNGYGLSYDSVFKFRRSLLGSPYFDTVKIIYIRSTQISEQATEQFEIRCGVKIEKLGGGMSKDGTDGSE